MNLLIAVFGGVGLGVGVSCLLLRQTPAELWRRATPLLRWAWGIPLGLTLVMGLYEMLFLVK